MNPGDTPGPSLATDPSGAPQAAVTVGRDGLAVGGELNEPGRAKPCSRARVLAVGHPALDSGSGEAASPDARERGRAAGWPQRGLSKLHIPSPEKRIGELVVHRGASLLKLKLDNGRTY